MGNSPVKRAELLERLRAPETWDLIVIGGGATGLGTAVDAASRVYRTLLLDAHDFAKGTSSRSTKLVHGGVRYLAQGNISLVREALHERALLSKNAPHLVHDLPFLVPAYHWWERPYYGLGLRAYDLLASGQGWGRSRSVTRDEALARVPTLEPQGLRGGIVYHDGQFDDARLAVSLLRTLLDQGGLALNYLEVNGLRKTADKVAGVSARDAETGEEFALNARAVVNATGVLADSVRRLDDPQAPGMIAPSQGAHLVLDRAFLPGDCAVMVPRTDDGRVLFVIPWHGRALVGTTDTPVRETPLEPRPLAEEIAFLLKHAARYLSRDPEPSDILSTYAGLRPLIGRASGTDTAKLSREHAVVVSASGLVTITGGKWTTYRAMGASAVAHAAQVAGLPPRPCVTENLRLHDSPPPEPTDDPALAQPLHDRLPYRAADVVQAARFEPGSHRRRRPGPPHPRPDPRRPRQRRRRPSRRRPPRPRTRQKYRLAGRSGPSVSGSGQSLSFLGLKKRVFLNLSARLADLLP